MSHLRAFSQDIFQLLFHPSQLFGRLPRENRGNMALVFVMLSQALLGYAYVQTGVADYEIAVASQQAINEYAKQHSDDQAETIDDTLATMEQGAKFQMLLNRLFLILGGPLQSLGTVGLLTALLFAIVALSGAKPNGRTLSAIVAFALVTELPRLMLQYGLSATVGASRVDVSAAALLTHPDVSLAPYLLLRRLDPFALWFWLLVAVGLVQSGQLSRRVIAGVTVASLAILAALIHVLSDAVAVAQFPMPT